MACLERVLGERLPDDYVCLQHQFAGCDFRYWVTYGASDGCGISTFFVNRVPVLTTFDGEGLWAYAGGPIIVTSPETLQSAVDNLRRWVEPHLGQAWLAKLVPVFVGNPVGWVCYDFRFDPVNPPLVLIYGEADDDRPILYIAPTLDALIDTTPDPGLIAAEEEYWQETLYDSQYVVRPRQLEWEASRDAWLEQHRLES